MLRGDVFFEVALTGRTSFAEGPALFISLLQNFAFIVEDAFNLFLQNAVYLVLETVFRANRKGACSIMLYKCFATHKHRACTH